MAFLIASSADPDDDGDITQVDTIEIPALRQDIDMCCQLCLMEEQEYSHFTLDVRRLFLSICADHWQQLLRMSDAELAVAEEVHFIAVLRWAFPYFARDRERER